MLSISFLEPKEYAFNTLMFKSMFNSYKHFSLDATQVYSVNNNHINIGIITVHKNDQGYTVKVFKTPNVCRLSFIALLEASVFIAKKLEMNSEEDVVTFKLYISTYIFKYKMIFKDLPFNESGENISISLKNLKTIENKDITKRNVEFA